MTSIVLIGNDHGGAVLLSCMLDEMLKHYDLRALASGPAYDLWKRSAITIEDIGVNDLKARLKYLQPDLIVTGTSHYSELERSSWIAAQDLNIPSLAVIDAWVNFPERFTRLSDNTLIRPDAFTAIDQHTETQIRDLLGDQVRSYVTGHPHLEGIVIRHHNRSQKPRGNTPPKVMFFSNPVHAVGYEVGSYRNQFDAIEMLFEACASSKEKLVLGIKPHPREPHDQWQAWAQRHKNAFAQGWVRFEDAASEDLIENSDIVAGITSMALVEGVLMNKSVLSIQLSRHVQTNPILDAIDGLRIADNESQVAEQLEITLKTLDKVDSSVNTLSTALINSSDRLLNAIRREVQFEHSMPFSGQSL